MLKSIKSLAIVGMAVAMFGLSGLASAEVAKSTHPIKVVYHVNDVADATNAMRNANNHLEADPTVKITFVTHSKGIDFLLLATLSWDQSCA